MSIRKAPSFKDAQQIADDFLSWVKPHESSWDTMTQNAIAESKIIINKAMEQYAEAHPIKLKKE